MKIFWRVVMVLFALVGVLSACSPPGRDVAGLELCDVMAPAAELPVPTSAGEVAEMVAAAQGRARAAVDAAPEVLVGDVEVMATNVEVLALAWEDAGFEPAAATSVYAQLDTAGFAAASSTVLDWLSANCPNDLWSAVLGGTDLGDGGELELPGEPGDVYAPGSDPLADGVSDTDGSVTGTVPDVELPDGGSTPSGTELDEDDDTAGSDR